MKIVVAGRFDYVEIIFRELAQKEKIIYFENDAFIPETMQTRIHRRWYNALYRLGIISEAKHREEELLDNYRELFDVDSLHKSDDILFVIYEMNVLSTDFKTIKLLKQRYPKAKFVLYFTNIIGSVRTEESADILKNRELYDIIYTYSSKDAPKYGFEYLLFEPYYKIECDIDERYDSDVFWLGHNKGRYKTVLQIQKKLQSLGLKTKIMLVDKDLPEQNEPIEVLQEGLSYKEYIKYVIGTKCLLDIEEHGALTTRFTEAIAYRKLLLTNCTEKVDSDELKDIDQIIRFTDINDLENLDLSKRRKHYIDPRTVSAEGFLDRIIHDLFSEEKGANSTVVS